MKQERPRASRSQVHLLLLTWFCPNLLLTDTRFCHERAGVFQVTVCDGAHWVVGRDKLGLDLSWEGHSSQVRGSFSVTEDASHAGFDGVRGSEVARILGDNLC